MGQTYFEDYQAMFSSLAKSMSYAIRLQSTYDGLPTAKGVAYQDKPHVQVRWGWLVFPATLLALALLWLLATIITTARENAPLWKGSSLAAFSHPLTSETRSVVSDVGSPTRSHQHRRDHAGKVGTDGTRVSTGASVRSMTYDHRWRWNNKAKQAFLVKRRYCSSY